MTPPPPQPSGRLPGQGFFEGYDIVIEGPGDKTRRPRRPSIPYTPPEGIPLPPEKRKDEPLPPGQGEVSPGDAEPAA